ncbi:ABC transporter permease [Paenibacillus athensensis]|uniref:Transport permease protein n=1 Tax=Paenibacillus athensensis TaxID=1967502 RepID=A0A4Y8Q4U6_9BACL|nr:ABC transporter permease [Paenibacillus athensensis]MCD1258350.1 ABC transporter permease [Paenibacillus athensensis]
MPHAAAAPQDASGRRIRTPQALLYLQHVWLIIDIELKKLRKDPTELLMRAIQPMLWLLVFGQAFSRIRGVPTGGADYMSFLAPGILAQSVTFVSIFYGISIIWEKDMGLLQKFLATPIRRSAMMIGKMLSASLRAISQGIIILLLSLLLGVKLDWGVGQVIGVFVTVILGAAFFAGMSMTIAALVRTRERMMGIGQVITMPLFFASNALYPISIMPAWLKAVATVNPMSYLVDALRGLLLTTQSASLALDWGVLVLAGAVMATLASLLYPRIAN